jgi:hypothetical protein
MDTPIDRDSRNDEKMKSKGFTHVIRARLLEKGVERQVRLYTMVEPEQSDIDRLLRNSSVKDDYTVSGL